MLVEILAAEDIDEGPASHLVVEVDRNGRCFDELQDRMALQAIISEFFDMRFPVRLHIDFLAKIEHETPHCFRIGYLMPIAFVEVDAGEEPPYSSRFVPFPTDVL